MAFFFHHHLAAVMNETTSCDDDQFLNVAVVVVMPRIFLIQVITSVKLERDGRKMRKKNFPDELNC